MSLDLVAQSLKREPLDRVRESPLSRLLEHPTASDIDLRRVIDTFKQSQILVLGHSGEPAGILHFTVDDGKKDARVMLPMFTSTDALRQALLLNEDWRPLTVLEVNGDEFLPNVDDDVTVVVNPWTPIEYMLPPRRSSDTSGSNATVGSKPA